MQIYKEITDMTNYKYKYSMSKQSCIIKNAMTTKAIGYRVTSGKVRLFFLPTPESLRMRQPLFCLPICVCCNNTLQFTRCFKIESECHPSVYRKCPFIVYAGAIMHLPTFPSKKMSSSGYYYCSAQHCIENECYKLCVFCLFIVSFEI